MRTIEIDFDVHKLIESDRHSFEETSNDVLRRILGLDGGSVRAQPSAATGRPWSGKGVTLPSGTALEMEYNGTLHSGEIDDGVWVVEENRFKSPSAAAGGVALTKHGRHPSLDGWIYWRVKRPDDKDWIPLSSLRPRLPRTAPAARPPAHKISQAPQRPATDSAEAQMATQPVDLGPALRTFKRLA